MKAENRIILIRGTGKIGKQVLSLLAALDIRPDYFVDRDQNLEGTVIEGISVISPEIAKEIQNKITIVAIANHKNVVDELESDGLTSEDYILPFEHDELLRLIKMICNYVTPSTGAVQYTKTVFAVDRGMVLGGVETWSVQEALRMKSNGLETEILTTNDNVREINVEDSFPITELCTGGKSLIERLNEGINYFKNQDPCILVCGFPRQLFFAGCLYKMTHPGHVFIAAVVHNDEDVYYDTYNKWMDAIDICMVISSRMKKKLENMGYPANRIVTFNWSIPIEERLVRDYYVGKRTLQIGYAGRVTVTQKRVDRIPDLAQKLLHKQIDFIINIAGTGDFEEEIVKAFTDRGMKDRLRMHGYIPKDKIADFWKTQDIMIGCSDIEGHSISQCEAMTNGAVPVVNDTSGAEDDITDGYNGYIVPIGDVELMAERIVSLYNDHTLLRRMSIRCHERIEENNNRGIFERLLKEALT